MTSADTHAPATGAEEVGWDLEPLVDGRGADGVEALLDHAVELAAALTADAKGKVGDADAATIAGWLDREAEIDEAAHRAASYAQLRFATDVADPARGALVAQVQERLSELAAELVWFELEWLAIDDDRAADLLDDPALTGHRHHLETARVRRPHVLSEPEDRLLTTKAPTGAHCQQLLP